MPADPFPPATGAPTLRTLAALAGVSPMTVSLALRNHPSISPATRERVKKLATAHGYQPDPVIAKLMHHLRKRRVHASKSTLCGLRMRSLAPETTPASDYGNEVLRGARQRAESLGFRLDVMSIDEEGLRPRRLQQILINRGVDGIVLLPMRTPVRLAGLLDWSRFSAVSATPSVITPRLHEAMPDLFGNTLLLCGKLAERPCKRIGLVVVAEHDVRVNHRVLAAFLWHSRFAGDTAIPPLITPQYDPDADAIHRWIEEHNPDAIFTNSESTLNQIFGLLSNRQRRQITLASTTLLAPSTSRFSGIADNAHEVGAAAVEIVAAMIQRGECGLPTTPRTTLIAGEYFVPPRGRHKSPKQPGAR